MPNPMFKKDLYAQLMRYYGAPYDQIGDANDILKQMGVDIDTSDYYDPNDALVDSPLGDFMVEASANEFRKQTANRMYDEQQPYGFNFSGEHAGRLEDDSTDMYYDPNWSGPHAFYAGKVGTPYEGDMYIGNGDVVPQPGDEGFIGDAKNALVPIAQAAGSYALPMLFSMLMRGGK